MHRRRHRLVAQHQHCLDQAGDTCRSRGVADIGLDRSDGQRARARAEHRGQRVQFQRIAQPCTGAVRLDGIHRLRRQISVSQRRPDDCFLRTLVGRRNTGAASILIEPLPGITARTWSPAACASASRFSTTMPQPSPRPNPSAAASNVLHRPSGAIMRARLVPPTTWAPASRCAPPARQARIRLAQCLHRPDARRPTRKSKPYPPPWPAR